MTTIIGTANPEILTGTLAADTIQALAADDVAYGFDGNDRVEGGDGDDILYGGSGDDALDGGAGEDFLYGQSGNDLVSYASALAGLTLDLQVPGLSTGAATGDVLQSIERLTLTAFADTLRGSVLAEFVHAGDGDDLLIGDGGHDRLFGDQGNDTLVGGAGNDTLSGGQGNDTASYRTSAQAVIINLADPSQSSDEGRADTWISIEAVEGSAFNHRITLGGGITSALGGTGRDRL